MLFSQSHLRNRSSGRHMSDLMTGALPAGGNLNSSRPRLAYMPDFGHASSRRSSFKEDFWSFKGALANLALFTKNYIFFTLFGCC